MDKPNLSPFARQVGQLLNTTVAAPLSLLVEDLCPHDPAGGEHKIKHAISELRKHFGSGRIASFKTRDGEDAWMIARKHWAKYRKAIA